MPTYDYRCKSCEHEFELFQNMSDRVKRKCPECGKNTLERLIGTGAAVLFKGSGFYETDYRSESYKKAAKADSEKKSSASDKSKAKTETKSSDKKPKSDKPAKKDTKTSKSD
jgi:putative FmdB family regulatory protein